MINQDFFMALEALERDKGISQEKLAFDVGAEKSYITNIENGLRCPSMYGLFVILEALEIDFKTFADFEV